MPKRRRPDSDDDSDPDTDTIHLPFKNRLKPDSQILSILKTLKTASTKSGSTSKTLTLNDLSLSSTCREVTDLPLSSVQSRIQTLAISLAKSILSGNGFSFSVPSRAATNQLYVPELDRIVLKDKSSNRPYSSVSTAQQLVYGFHASINRVD